MTSEAQARFERCKQENIDHFNFARVIAGVRATRFGWGRFASDKPDDWFLQRAIGFAIDVMDSAFNLALEVNAEAWSECGGFRATARPSGAVMLQFVLESRYGADWEEEEEENTRPAMQQTINAVVPIMSGPRRIQKLHKET